MKLSIVICTTGVRKELIDCLNSIKQLNDVEVLVVVNSDNNVKLDTKLKPIYENKIGLSHARNTGWKKAKGKYIAYIDDDSIADKNWIKNILRFIQKHPKVKAFGGPYFRHSRSKIPNWIPDDFGILNHGMQVKKLKQGGEWLSGTNMIFKKTSLMDVGGFNTNMGMSGNKVNYGEETDLQIKLHRKIEGIWYDPKIKVSHLLSERKMNISWIIKDSFIRGRNNRYIKNSHENAFSQSRGNKQAQASNNFFQATTKAIQLIAYAIGDIYGRVVT